MKVRLQVGKNNRTKDVYMMEGGYAEISGATPEVYRYLVEEALKSYGIADNATTVTYRMQLPQAGKGPRCIIINVQGKSGERKLKAKQGTHLPYFGGWEPDSMA